ncbi:hypothetical protein ACF0H5_006030 [Mactra antiquata]
MKMLIHLLGVALLMATTVSADIQYMLVVPKILRTGLDFTAELVLFEAAPNNINAQVTIRRGDVKTSELAWDNAEMTIDIAAGNSKGSNSMVIPNHLPAGYKYYVFVTFTGMTVVAAEPQEVESARMSPALFIQTDKPIYKPGDTVHFRVLALDKDLKPLPKVVTVQIKNPSGDIIMKKLSQQPNSADFVPLIQDDFLLDRDPKLGDYEISASHDTEEIVATFKVDKYVLPKFEVTITLDRNYGVSGPDAVVTGRVSAKYSYGEMVKGDLEIMSNGKVIQDVDKFDGSHDFTVPVDTSIVESFNDRYRFSNTMSISAKVTEKVTGNVMEDSTSFTLYSTNFIASVVEPLPIHFQGMTMYSFQVELTDPLGNDLSDWDTTNQNSNDLSKYTLKYLYGTKEDKIENLTENPVTIDVTFNINDTYPSLEVWFEYKNSELRSPRSRVSPPTYFTATNTSLQVTLVSQNENEACFAVSPYKTGDIVYYQIVDNYNAGNLMTYVYNSQKGGQCFNIARENAPLSMVVAYKVETVRPSDMKESVESLITANFMLEVPWSTEQQVSIEVSPEVVEPGDTVNIIIQAHQGSLVALTGIDKSLTFLANAIEITEAKLRASVESFRLFNLPEKKDDDFGVMPVRGGGGPMMIEKRKKRCIACYSLDQYVDAVTILEASGLKVITNLYVYRDQSHVSPDYYDYPVMMFGEAMMEAMPASADTVPDTGAENEISDDGAENEMAVKKPKVRSDFREVWLWNIEYLLDSSAKSIQRKVPDVITNWIVSAFAVDSIKGAGVANKKEVTVFQDFFLSMNLPYSVVRGELFSLQLVVYNYKTEKITVKVELIQSVNYTVVNPGSRTQVISIGGDSSGMVQVPIRMIKIGKPTIQARAIPVTGTTKSDTVIRELPVKAEGREIRRSLPLQIPMPAAQLNYEMDLSSYFLEPGMVDDSLYMMLHVTGDMMGPAIDAIGKQIRMPYGCGEQNIQSLTPGLFSAWYLKSIDRLERELMEKVARVLSRGYSKELQYKHKDGSYSAFGDGPSLCQCGQEGQKKGSAWLTAYVLKMFSLLYIHEMTYVDFNILQEAFTFLSNQKRLQCEDQFFVELGVLIHTEMQGGSSSKFGFTAFVLSAVLEFKDAAEKANNQKMITEANTLISEAVSWLSSRKDDLLATKNPYQMATVAYALSRAGGNDDSAIVLLDAARSLMQNGPGNDEPVESECQAKPSDSAYTYCTDDPDCQKNDSPGTWRYSPQKCCRIACDVKKACTSVNSHYGKLTGPTEVETFGYILMAALNLGKTAIAEDMKDKLLEIRDADGMYRSTQDTAVGMEAITRYSLANTNLNGGDFVIRAVVSNTEMSAPVIVTDYNYTVNSVVELPLSGKPDSVKVEVLKGITGTAFINLETVYNVNSNITDKPLVLEVQPRVTKDNRSVIETCVQKNSKSNVSLGTMVVEKIQLQSGCVYVDYAPLTDPKTAPTKVEVEEDGSIVNVYYMVDGDLERRCIHIIYERAFVVEDLKPAPVIAMDYYNPGNSVGMLYSTEQAVKDCIDCPTTGSSMVHCSATLMILALVCLILFSKL